MPGSEFMGTLVLVLLGNGMVAKVYRSTAQRLKRMLVGFVGLAGERRQPRSNPLVGKRPTMRSGPP